MMTYRYAVERQDYTDYSSGRVIYSQPGKPALSIRLVSEVFQRCKPYLMTQAGTGPWTIYDPCGGGAYHLTVLAYLHWTEIKKIISSDIDEQARALAVRNLSLLTQAGMERRVNEISQMYAQYGKASHLEALDSALRLKENLLKNLQNHPVHTQVFLADATDSVTIQDELRDQKVDLVITDIPYGQKSNWQINDVENQRCEQTPVWKMMEALYGSILPGTVVAVISDKEQFIHHAGYQHLQKTKIGKRQVVILKPA